MVPIFGSQCCPTPSLGSTQTTGLSTTQSAFDVLETAVTLGIAPVGHLGVNTIN